MEATDTSNSAKGLAENWIPFPQVTPTPSQKYLCWVEDTPYGTQFEVREWSWTNEFWEGRSGNERVTFYMPLPAPPSLCDELEAMRKTFNTPDSEPRSADPVVEKDTNP